ncbi:MAG: winged helix-turn-helix domain-containing protein [bacterium]|nr:winged helix-turn-helix domain-containing protein [bacterium]
MLATEVSLEINEIGENAGRVWDYISSHEECTLSSLKKGLKLSTEDCCYALGWLAREGRIDMRRKGISTRIFTL